MQLFGVLSYIYLYSQMKHSVKSCNNYGSPLWGNWKMTLIDLIIFALFIFYPSINGLLLGVFFILFQ